MSKPSVRIIEMLTIKWKSINPDLPEEDIAKRLQSGGQMLTTEVLEVILEYLDEQYEAERKLAVILQNPYYSDENKVAQVKKYLSGKYPEVSENGAAVVTSKNYKGFEPAD